MVRKKIILAVYRRHPLQAAYATTVIWELGLMHIPRDLGNSRLTTLYIENK